MDAKPIRGKRREYTEFYRHVRVTIRIHLVGVTIGLRASFDYTSLLRPKSGAVRSWNREGARGLKLYIQRTFIMDDAEQFLPLYLRFVKGVLDSQDLPLNISREILQQSPQVDSLRNAVTKRVLDMLSKWQSQTLISIRASGMYLAKVQARTLLTGKRLRSYCGCLNS